MCFLFKLCKWVECSTILMLVLGLFTISHDGDFCSYQFKRFHRDLIAELERKTDMDVKYMNVSGFLTETVIRLLKCLSLCCLTALALIQCLGYSLCGASHVLLVSIWVSNTRSVRFVLPQNMSVGGLASLNNRWVWTDLCSVPVCSHCMHRKGSRSIFLDFSKADGIKLNMLHFGILEQNILLIMY